MLNNYNHGISYKYLLTKNINKLNINLNESWKFRFKVGVRLESSRVFSVKSPFKLWIGTLSKTLSMSLGNFNFKTLFKHFNTFNNVLFKFYYYSFKVIVLTNKALRLESSNLNNLSGLDQSPLSKQYLGGIRGYKYHAIWVFRLLSKVEKPSLVVVSDDLMAKSSFKLPRQSFSVQFGDVLRLDPWKFNLTLPTESNNVGFNFVLMSHIYKVYQITSSYKVTNLINFYVKYRLMLKFL